MKVRTAAALALKHVIKEQQSLTKVMVSLEENIPPTQRALFKAICFGSLRYYFQLNHLTENLLLSPLRNKDYDVHCLLLVGLFQLLYLDMPSHVTVSETVSAATSLKKPWAKGLINKTLRRFINEKDALLKKMDKALEAKYAHPWWLIKAIKSAWPDQWESILLANNEHPPLTLRVNQQKISREDYLSQLQTAGISAKPVEDIASAIELLQPVNVTALPGFAEGMCYVQDAAGQSVATLMQPKNGARVLDACAAPGSKTTHLLEQNPNITLTAIDNNAERLKVVRDNLNRLGLAVDKVTLHHGDAANAAEWVKAPFDCILLDAPCSATGVIRRHPDIKVLRHESDIPEQSTKQLSLLNALWPLLKKDGVLLYTTCSILPAENEAVITHFIREHADAKSLAITVPKAITLPHGQQVLPGSLNRDGFYYALLKKI